MVYRVKQCSRCTGADLPLNERNWVVTLLSLNVNSNFKANCKIVFIFLQVIVSAMRILTIQIRVCPDSLILKF